MLILSNVQGKIIESWQVNEIYQLQIETKNLNHGVYLITLIGENNKITKKLIVN